MLRLHNHQTVPLPYSQSPKLKEFPEIIVLSARETVHEKGL